MFEPDLPSGLPRYNPICKALCGMALCTFSALLGPRQSQAVSVYVHHSSALFVYSRHQRHCALPRHTPTLFQVRTKRSSEQTTCSAASVNAVVYHFHLHPRHPAQRLQLRPILNPQHYLQDLNSIRRSVLESPEALLAKLSSPEQSRRSAEDAFPTGILSGCVHRMPSSGSHLCSHQKYNARSNEHHVCACSTRLPATPVRANKTH